MTITIGVLGLQGDLEEHVSAWKQALEECTSSGNVRVVKKKEDLGSLSAISLPGGESTVMGGLASRSELFSELKERILDGLPVLGTCAGMILLSKGSRDRVVTEKKQPLLGVLDIEVERNHYGRQGESFEKMISISVLGPEPYRGVFIRAPVVRKIGDGVKSLAELDGEPACVSQGNLLATSFHPELSGDNRLHSYFLREYLR